jgi:predicted AAA+ superfamily ATPase
MITRIAEKILRDQLASAKVTVILGARQVGKTTLTKQVTTGRNTQFLNFDITTDLQRFVLASRMAPAQALAYLQSPDILVLDEVQRWPEATRVIKGWYDQQLPVKCILLGSSALQLREQTAEALTGRNYQFILPPLLWAETLQTQAWYSAELAPALLRDHAAPALRDYLLARMALGSYPEVVTTPKPTELLRQLAQDYLWKDVLYEGGIKSPGLIQRLLQMLALQIGSEVSISELATALGAGRNTIQRYLDLLEMVWVIFRLPAYSTNPRKEITAKQKIFFWDVGIRNALINRIDITAERDDIGHLWENWALAEIAKLNLLTGQTCELFFWRTYDQAEVNLVVRRAGQLHAFEMRWNPRRKARTSFTSHYQVPVQILSPADPFLTAATNLFNGSGS